MPGVIISSAACVIGILIITWLHNQYRIDIVVEPCSAPNDNSTISVCIPARNEERNIDRCVKALLDQTYHNYEIIVLDDRSTDATANILKGLQKSAIHKNVPFLVLMGSALPSGWAGKPHALAQAAAKAEGEWLCFVDADTILRPEALTSIYSKTLETRADLFTIMTHQVMQTFWERTVLPLVMTALSVGFSPQKINDPDRKDAIANGQCIFIKRTVFESLGGYAPIKDSIVEDKDLAMLVKSSGYRLVIAEGQAVASTRMYTSLSEMWEGWTKNIYLGLRDDRGLLLLGVFGVFLAIITAVILPAWVLVGIYFIGTGTGWEGSLVLIEGILLWLYLIYWRVLVSRAMNIPGWYAFTIPIGAGVFSAMMLASAWKVLMGKGVTWKGRRYSQ